MRADAPPQAADSKMPLMSMTKSQVITLSALECISLALIARLWRRKHKARVWQRCLYSVILLVPILGWVFYAFIAVHPEAHSDELPERWGGAAPPGS
jgi:hypothetical protein